MSLLDRVRSGAWLDEQRFAPIQWAVAGLIPEGFGLLTGAPKAGKSWAALGIGLAVASGEPAFGCLDVGPERPVLLLALEDGDRRIQGRCRALLGDGVPIPPLLDFLTDATPAEVLELIREWLEQHAGKSPLVILDTLGKVMPPALPGEGAYQRDYRVGSRLKKLVDPHPGACLLVVHHIRKASTADGDWMDSTSGTNGLNGAADWTCNLHRARNEDHGVIRVTGRDVVEGEYAVTCDTGHWALDGTSLHEAARNYEHARATADLGDRSADIIAFVARNGPSAPKDVEAALSMPDARRYLARLGQSGRLVKLARGLYGPVPTVPMSQLPDAPESLGVSRVYQHGTTGQWGQGYLETERPRGATA